MTLYEIAYHLHIPVYVLLTEMPFDELQKWQEYFSRRPVGWREDDRVLKLLQIQGFKGSPGSVFPSLGVIFNKQATVKEDGKLDINAFKQSDLFNRILSAQSGDKINYES